VRVQVAAVSVGVVPFQGARPTSSKERYLIIRLLIQHSGAGGALHYDHSGLAACSITDDRGAPLARANFAAGELPLGQASRMSLHPGRFVEDVVVCAVPPEGAGGVRLRLPASAWNGAGEFAFFIPVAMIQRDASPR
jgi:hypothetical protein